MNFIWIPIGILLMSILTGSHSQPSDESSLIDPKINLEPKLRKALLKVLTNIDDETINQQNTAKDNQETENDQSSETKPGVQKVFNVHSFSADQGTENQNGGVEEEINFIISKKHTPVELEPDTIVAGSSDTESRASKTSNLLSTLNKNINNFVTTKPDDLSTPAPTVQTETDGSNSDTGKVEEVQFFSAPLVAAFTVHQDEQGLPHSVIPLYNDDSNSNKQRDINKATSTNVNNNVLHPSVIIGDDKPSLFQQQLFQLYKERQQQQEVLLQQRQRQRELEEQRRLQDQQRLLQLRLKEEELRRQQQENQRRQQLFRQQSSVISFQPSISTSVNSQPSFLVQQQLPTREAVDFLASLRQQNIQDLPLQQNHIPLNFNQALPPLQQVNTQSSSLNPLQQVNTQSSSLNNFVLGQSDPGLNSNRIYRQEQQTSNFGLNPNTFRQEHQTNNFGLNQNTFRQEQQTNNFGLNQNTFRQQPSVQTSFQQDFRQLQLPLQNSIQDFRQPIDFRQQPSYTLADRQLKNLLQQSGVYQTSDGRQEDLNIVSKVLSLNHFGGQFNGILRRSGDSQKFYFEN